MLNLKKNTNSLVTFKTSAVVRNFQILLHYAKFSNVFTQAFKIL